MNEEAINKNLSRGGEYFIYSLWIQSQMADLIILKEHPRIIKKFVENKKTIPPTLRKNRMIYWEKDFGFVRKAFVKNFGADLSSQALADLDTVYGIRNAIAHSHVSLARNYFLYRPGSIKKLREFKKAFDLVRSQDADTAKPVVYKFDFSNDQIYLHNFAAITRLDEVHLKNLAKSLKIPHSRIR